MGRSGWGEGFACAAAGAALLAGVRWVSSAAGASALPPVVGAAVGLALGGAIGWRFTRHLGGFAWMLPFASTLVGMLAADVGRGSARIGSTIASDAPMPAGDFAALQPGLAAVYGPVVGEERWVEPATASGVRGSSRQRVTECLVTALGPLGDGELVWTASIRQLDVPDLAANGPRLYERVENLVQYESCAQAVASLDPAARAAFDVAAGRYWLATDDPAERTVLNDTGANAAWVFGVVWSVGAVVAAVRMRR